MPATRTPTGQSRIDPADRLREACQSMLFAGLRAARAEAAEEDLSLPQLFLLGAIHRAGPTPVTRLTSWTGAAPATISGILGGLEELRLLRRTHSTSDRRQVLVSLSPEGIRIVARIEARRRRRWMGVESGIGAKDRAVTARVIEKINAALVAGLHDLREVSAPSGRHPLQVAA